MILYSQNRKSLSIMYLHTNEWITENQEFLVFSKPTSDPIPDYIVQFRYSNL